IAVCRHLAPEIEARIEEETGWEVRRVGLKVRNPDNAADVTERGILLGYESRAAGGQDPALFRTIRLEERDGKQMVHFTQAIPMFDMCEACHGANIAPEVMSEIRALYPEDQAVGYHPGDIRGAFSLLKEYAPARAEPPVDRRYDWSAIERMTLPGSVELAAAGATGDPVAGRTLYDAKCRRCHGAADLAQQYFAPDGAGGAAFIRKLGRHGGTDETGDRDIAAFLKVLAEGEAASTDKAPSQ
ncbi:MAG TPA: DUF3365 domain-containing protein, partial [Afifellaceae bacterium]|nr:DUF3365 domain-containing protein [Afifellaceae bacterium]